ncbi:MAG: hypothetical protein A4S14_05735 [Proteobacteria bacterium SG_bin9]|nr:MAG: hypothetical protein A4S14_05735 [Proteobacteria bacterium SG_bin9]
MSAPDDELGALAAQIIKTGSKSFAAAAKLFPAETRTSAHLLYAWCRHCDDVIDGQTLGFESGEAGRHDPARALDQLRIQTKRAIAGATMDDPIFEALKRVCAKHEIPAAYPLALLDGFQMDVENRTYASLNETLTYCYHVAGVVGIMMSMIMGAREETVLDRANDLGLAFQLSNIARDVLDDAKLDRVYLPAEWLSEVGVEAMPAAILAPDNRSRLSQVARRLVDEAEKYYDSSLHGLEHLDLRSAWAIAAAHSIYRKIGKRVVERGADAWDTRSATSKVEKLGSVVSAAGTALYAHSLGKLSQPEPRAGLWTRPLVEQRIS